MMHSMFPIIPLATDPGDLRPVESLALTTPLVVAIVACLLLAVGLIALIIMLSRPARKPRNSDRARGAHSNASSKAEWRARIDDVVARHRQIPVDTTRQWSASMRPILGDSRACDSGTPNRSAYWN